MSDRVGAISSGSDENISEQHAESPSTKDQLNRARSPDEQHERHDGQHRGDWSEDGRALTNTTISIEPYYRQVFTFQDYTYGSENGKR